MNRIVLFLDGNQWFAKFSGPHSDEMLRLFHTVVVPTAYTSASSAETVLAEIRKRNNGVAVEIAQDVAA